MWAAAQGVRRARPTRVTAQVRLAWGEARGRSDRGRAGRGDGCAPRSRQHCFDRERREEDEFEEWKVRIRDYYYREKRMLVGCQFITRTAVTATFTRRRPAGLPGGVKGSVLGRRGGGVCSPGGPGAVSPPHAPLYSAPVTVLSSDVGLPLPLLGPGGPVAAAGVTPRDCPAGL